MLLKLLYILSYTSHIAMACADVLWFVGYENESHKLCFIIQKSLSYIFFYLQSC